MTITERLDLMLAEGEPGSVLILSNADWFALRAERAPGVDDHGARGLTFRGRRVYVGDETRLMGADEAAEWGIGKQVPRKPDFITFEFELAAPELSYDVFAVSAPSPQLDDALAIAWQAACIAPDKFAGRRALVSATGLYRDELKQRRFLGTIVANKKAIDTSFYVQRDVALALAAFASSAVKFVTLHVEDFKGGRGDVTGAFFEGPRKLHAEGLPVEE